MNYNYQIDSAAKKIGDKCLKTKTPEQIADAISEFYENKGIALKDRSTRALSYALPSFWACK